MNLTTPNYAINVCHGQPAVGCPCESGKTHGSLMGIPRHSNIRPATCTGNSAYSRTAARDTPEAAA
jgi:hypothetical protein